jgi:hypothetical protein
VAGEAAVGASETATWQVKPQWAKSHRRRHACAILDEHEWYELEESVYEWVSQVSQYVTGSGSPRWVSQSVSQSVSQYAIGTRQRLCVLG